MAIFLLSIFYKYIYIIFLKNSITKIFFNFKQKNFGKIFLIFEFLENKF